MTDSTREPGAPETPDIHSYPSEDLTVEYDAARCIHAAVCVRELPAVFEPGRKPWVDATAASAGRILDVVCGCPTGALQVRRTDGGAEERPPETNRVRVVPRGPLYVTGDLRLALNDGRTLHETRLALCRCGESRNKPFCDNAHRDCGFDDPGAAMEDRLRPADGEAPESAPLEMRLAPDGPILLAGPVTVACDDGTASTGAKGALCRCGASETKPYCDGTHKRIDFHAE